MKKNNIKNKSSATPNLDVKNKTVKSAKEIYAAAKLYAQNELAKSTKKSSVTAKLDVKCEKPKTTKTSSKTNELEVKNKKQKTTKTSSTKTSLDIKNKTSKSIKGGKFRGVEQIYKNVAGIDIGSKLIHVAIVDEKDEYQVREFGTSTPELLEIAKWLKASKVQFAPMEATGVYWVPLFEI